MKKVLIVCAMFFAFSSFANNSSEKVKGNENVLKITKHEFVSKKSDDGIVTVYCYVTIRNSETGETRKVYGVGDSLDQCGRNAYALALKVVDNLNGQ